MRQTQPLPLLKAPEEQTSLQASLIAGVPCYAYVQYDIVAALYAGTL